jgi:hypothetical protein
MFMVYPFSAPGKPGYEAMAAPRDRAGATFRNHQRHTKKGLSRRFRQHFPT